MLPIGRRAHVSPLRAARARCDRAPSRRARASSARARRDRRHPCPRAPLFASRDSRPSTFRDDHAAPSRTLVPSVREIRRGSRFATRFESIWAHAFDPFFVDGFFASGRSSPFAATERAITSAPGARPRRTAAMVVPARPTPNRLLLRAQWFLARGFRSDAVAPQRREHVTHQGCAYASIRPPGASRRSTHAQVTIGKAGCVTVSSSRSETGSTRRPYQSRMTRPLVISSLGRTW